MANPPRTEEVRARMMGQLSCLSSKKDVVDSCLQQRPSRRHHAVGPHEMKMVMQQRYFGGKPHPLPLPKPEDAQQGDDYDCNQRRLCTDDQLMMFARTSLTSPPPPVSSPTSSSGKCSPASAMAVVLWKPQQQEQEHPSPARDVPSPPPPWSTSSEETSSSSSPWASPGTLTLQVPTHEQSPSLTFRDDAKVLAFKEIEKACNREHEIVVTGRGESCVVTTWDEDDQKLVAIVWHHRHSRQGWKEWATKVKLISRLDDPHICKLQGYCGVRGVEEQILVYEHVCTGSLSNYLFGSLCKALLDWLARVRIALGAARALACLHDLAPVEVVYKDFKSSNILLDLDFSVKLAGHGLDVIPRHCQVDASTVLRRREASNKSNIRSYGVLLLELLTGKAMAGQDESLFARWAKPILKFKGGQQQQLASILDPQLRRQLPCPGLKKVIALTRQCLRKDATKRPSISEIVDILDSTAMQALLQPASCCNSHRRKSSRSSSYYKCLSLGRSQPSDQTRFSRSISSKHFSAHSFSFSYWSTKQASHEPECAADLQKF